VPPMEALYRQELFRACYYLLGNIFLIAEWRGPGSRGIVDFYIKSTKWAIECDGDGDRLPQHVERFQRGGILPVDHIYIAILLDFRTSMPEKARGISPFRPF
jgi:hypothetical protein